jgi:hypothetical protein
LEVPLIIPSGCTTHGVQILLFPFLLCVEYIKNSTEKVLNPVKVEGIHGRFINIYLFRTLKRVYYYYIKIKGSLIRNIQTQVVEIILS